MPTANDLLNAVLSGLGIGGLFAVTALGLSLVFGVMKLMNLAHGEFIVLGAYIVYYLGTSAGLDPLVAALIAAPAVALLAYPLQHYALSSVMSRGAEAPLLITFGVSVVLQNVFIVAFSADVRSLNAGYASANIKLLGVTLPVIYIICLVVAVILLGATHLIVTRTGFGRRLRASSEDAVAAAVMGVNVKRVYSMTYALAAGSAALGGCSGRSRLLLRSDDRHNVSADRVRRRRAGRRRQRQGHASRRPHARRDREHRRHLRR